MSLNRGWRFLAFKVIANWNPWFFLSSLYLYFFASLYVIEQLILVHNGCGRKFWKLIGVQLELVWLIYVGCTNYLIQSGKETHIHIAEPGISPISPCHSQIVIFTWILLHSKDEQEKKICLKGQVWT